MFVIGVSITLLKCLMIETLRYNWLFILDPSFAWLSYLFDQPETHPYWILDTLAVEWHCCLSQEINDMYRSPL